jgi:uncharacterized membrane protein YcaP (DUF421 family)
MYSWYLSSASSAAVLASKLPHSNLSWSSLWAASLTNAFIQILTVALTHFCIAIARAKSRWLARLLDGTPLILLENGQWRSETLSNMRIQDDDVMAQARDQGIATLDKIEIAILERNGQISIIEGSK